MRRAAEDIVVYKVVYAVTGKMYPYYYHGCFNFYYEAGKRYKTNVHVIRKGDKDVIENGFHSYEKNVCFRENTALNANRVILVTGSKVRNLIGVYCEDKEIPTCDGRIIRPDVSVVKCIIPKGTCFWKNEFGEVVSKEIIVTDEVFMKLENRYEKKNLWKIMKK